MEGLEQNDFSGTLQPWYCYFLSLFLGTKENTSAADTLQKVWAVLEQNIEQYAISLLR